MTKPSITFALSSEHILESVYALSAMQIFSSRIKRSEQPPVLSRDEAPALRRLLRGATINAVASLLPYVTDIDLDNEEILTVTLSLPEGRKMDSATQHLARLRLEEALAAGVLELVYYSSSPGISNDFQSRSTSAIDDLLAMIDRPVHLHLTPHGL